eukprot:1054489-Amphidinium_carterae.2
MFDIPNKRRSKTNVRVRSAPKCLTKRFFSVAHEADGDHGVSFGGPLLGPERGLGGRRSQVVSALGLLVLGPPETPPKNEQPQKNR